MRDEPGEVPGGVTLPQLHPSPGPARAHARGGDEEGCSPPLGVWISGTHKSGAGMRQGCKGASASSASALKHATGLTPNALQRLASGGVDTAARRASERHSGSDRHHGGRASMGGHDTVGRRDSVGRLDR